MYEGEDFTIQLDSHHRFAENWDAKLIEYMSLTGSQKPIIGSYAGVYDPEKDSELRHEPFKMVGERFTEQGTILFFPHVIQGWEGLQKPVRARFVSGHFFFTIGAHCEEYKYDPNLYFAGDEISLSIRSFTLGYDLFHPHRTLVWHEYTRKNRVKHWDDHTMQNRGLVGMSWHERDLISKRRLRKMLREETNDEDITGYDLGDVRSHKDYEDYAGINFAERKLHLNTKKGVEPPCDYSVWDIERKLELKWKKYDVAQCEDTNFVYFGVEDKLGNVLFRYDAAPDSPEARGEVESRHVSFYSCNDPYMLVVWPMSLSKGWLRKATYPLS